MEIKIVRQTKESETFGFQTIITEGFDIVYQLIEYQGKDDFQKSYNECSRSRENGKVIGIPDYFWKEDKKEIDPGFFLYIFYNEKGQTFNSFIICKHSIVYITNAGQTIDRIAID